MSFRILLTAFGSHLAYDYVQSFAKIEDAHLFLSDADPQNKARLLTDDFLITRRGADPDYAEDLFEQARRNEIQIIVPGSDEEALALMPHRERFAAEGIVVTVQGPHFLPIFASKSSLYDRLAESGFEVPEYAVCVGASALQRALESMGYGRRTLFIKPNTARGGAGIARLSELLLNRTDNIPEFTREEFLRRMDSDVEYILMPDIEGAVYDVDLFKYHDGELFIGPRRRVNNVTKFFAGHYFDDDDEIREFVRSIYALIPSEYLLDYDILRDAQGKLHLLEVNPRPSGSMVTYLPYGINMYYILAQSALYQRKLPISADFFGEASLTFTHMVRGKLS